MSTAPTFKRPQTAQEAVLEELRRLIYEGHFQPGDAIRPDSLARDLGVSRVPVREALKILEGEEVVGYRPHVGYSVRRLSLAEIEEIYELRKLLETEALRCGIDQVTQEQLAEMRAILEQISSAEASGDVTELSSANRRLHAALVRPCGMPRLLRLIKSLYDATEAYRPVSSLPRNEWPSLRNEHEQIVDALERRDLSTVLTLTDQHRDHLLGEVRRAMGV